MPESFVEHAPVKSLIPPALAPCLAARPAFSSGYLGAACGKFISALSLLALASFPAGAVLADEAKLTQAIEQQLNVRLNSYASKQGWQVARILYSHQLNGAAPAPCLGELSIHNPSHEPLAKQRLVVSCALPRWQVNVLSQASLWIYAVHSARAIERGSVLAAEDVQLGELEVSRSLRDFYPSPEPLLGLAVKRRLRAKQLLTPNLVQNADLIARGELVKIIAQQHGISASAEGEALSAGALGELIRVRNLKSGKTIEAKVLAQGEVSSLY